MKRNSAAQFAVLSLIWGSSYPLIKVSGEGLNPGQLVLARLALGTLFLLAVGAAGGVRLPRPGAAWLHLTVAAILGMVAPFLLLAWGEQRTSAAMAGMLTGATPVLTLVLATVQLRSERATARRIVGLLLGFVGLLVVIGPWQGAGGTLGGDAACLAVAVVYAAQAVYVRKFLSDGSIAPMASAAAQTLVAMLLQAALLPALGWRTPSFTWSVSSSILLLGVCGSGVGYVLYYRLIADIGATGASSVNYVVPFLSLIISAVVLGETIAWYVPVGGVLIVVSILVGENQLRIPRLGRRNREPVLRPAPVTAEQ
jgi:drug/metabolite transporter (DMT)-like permease